MSVPSTGQPECTCTHSLECNHGCHGRHCDPTEHTCSLEFLPDDGGLTPWGCAECTPGEVIPHLAGCAATAPMTRAPAPGIEPWPLLRT
jgi:hypothetical protein